VQKWFSFSGAARKPQLEGIGGHYWGNMSSNFCRTSRGIICVEVTMRCTTPHGIARWRHGGGSESRSKLLEQMIVRKVSG